MLALGDLAHGVVKAPLRSPAERWNDVCDCHSLMGGTASLESVVGEGMLRVSLVASPHLLSVACRQALPPAGGKGSPPLAGV